MAALALELQLHPQYGEDSKELSSAEVGHFSQLETGQRDLGNTGLRGDDTLFQAQAASSFGHGFAQFGQGLH